MSRSKMLCRKTYKGVPFPSFSLLPLPPGYARNSSVEELDSLKRGMGTKMETPQSTSPVVGILSLIYSFCYSNPTELQISNPPNPIYTFKELIDLVLGFGFLWGVLQVKSKDIPVRVKTSLLLLLFPTASMFVFWQSTLEHVCMCVCRKEQEEKAESRQP